MKKTPFSVEQITGILKQAELGTPVADLRRQHGVSEQSFLPLEEAVRWHGAFGGRELKELREENVTLKRLVAGLSRDKVMLQDVLHKNYKARQEARDRELT